MWVHRGFLFCTTSDFVWRENYDRDDTGIHQGKNVCATKQGREDYKPCVDQKRDQSKNNFVAISDRLLASSTIWRKLSVV